MSNILQVIVPIIIAGLVGFTIFTAFKRSVEKKMYKALIMDTNDTTVLAWLDAFKNSRNFMTRTGGLRIDNTISNSELVDDKLRFIQIWDIVKDSDNVSASVKDQVKKALLSESIPIKP